MATTMKGKGTVFAVDFTDTSTYTTVASRVTINANFGDVETVDVTHHDSVQKEMLPTIGGGGDVSLTCWFDPDDSGHTALFNWHKTPVVHSCRLTTTDSTPTNFTFDAILTGFQLGGMEVTGAISGDLTVQIAGEVVKS